MASDIHRGTRLPLLTATDPAPVIVANPNGRSPFLFIGDHAGNVIPSRLGTLGLPAADLERHVAWDIGIGALGLQLAEAMDATFVRQIYSRLVVDCNRGPEAVDAVAAISDGMVIPANVELPENARAARFAEVHEPYHLAVAGEIARRRREEQPTALIALHSFTPALANGVPRPWHIGVLHDRGDVRFATGLLDALRRNETLEVGDNEPYRMDTIDYTVPRHCYEAGMFYAEIEIRQDLVSSSDDRRRWSTLLKESLNDVWRSLGEPPPHCG